VPRYYGTTRSNTHAPYRKCPRCGWEGRDWGFKYRNLCKRCYAKWRREKAEEQRRLKGPNENVTIAEGVVVTRNVHDRFTAQAWSDIRWTGMLKWADCCEGIGLYLSLATLVALAFTYHSHPQYASLLVACAVIGYGGAWVAKRVREGEEARRRPEVQARLEELARTRQEQLNAARLFYASPEWRLLRDQVIAEQGRRCQQCGRHITRDFDLTVDHIKPRSRFPQLALDKRNLRVLCRQCNSSKGDTVLGGTMEPSGEI
jgi:5-methylcytosine-specific restriction endonuclease McrA